MDLPQGPVAIFWDMENCAIPCDIRPEDVAINIRTTLGAHPACRGTVTTFSAYEDCSSFSRLVREGCQRTGVKLIDVPNGRKDATDKAILIDMFLFSLDNHPPSSIMLISGDVDFSQALHILGQRGHTIILVIPSGVKVSPALCNAGQFVLDWPSVARGEGFVPPVRPFIVPPVVGPTEISRLVMGCQTSENPDTPKQKPIMHPRMSRSHCYNKDFSVTSHFLSSGASQPSSAFPSFSSANFSTWSLPSNKNEGKSGPLVNQNDASCWWIQSVNLNGLKGRLVKLLELSGGSMALAQISSKYQELFDQPLCVSGHGSCKLVNLLQKFSDVMLVEGKGAAQFVYLKNNSLGGGTANISKSWLLPTLGSKDKKGEEIQSSKIEAASLVSGSLVRQFDDHNVVMEDNSIGQKHEEKNWVPSERGLDESSGVVPSSFSNPTRGVSEVLLPATSALENDDEFRLEDVLRKFSSVRAINKKGEGKTIQTQSVNEDAHLVVVSSDELPNENKRLVSKENLTEEEEGKVKTMFQVRKQLVTLLQQSKGCLALGQIPEQYQKLFGQPLHVSQYGACDQLVNLLKEFSDEIQLEGEGTKELVRLKNFQGDNTTCGTTLVSPSLNNYENREGMIQNAHLVSGSSDDELLYHKMVVSKENLIEEDKQIKPMLQVKMQLVTLLEQYGGCLDLAQIPPEYQKFFGQPLHVSENNSACELVNILNEYSDVITVEGDGANKSVYLKNFQGGVTIGTSVLSKYEKEEGKAVQNGDEDAHLVPALSDDKGVVVVEDSVEKMEEKYPFTILQLKGQLVKLLELHGGFLALDKIHSEYYKLFNRLLCASEYGTRKLKYILLKFSDVMTIDGEATEKFVYLKTCGESAANCTTPPSPSLCGYKKGNEEGDIQDEDENTLLASRLWDKSRSDHTKLFSENILTEKERKEKAILMLKMQLVKLLEQSSGRCLSLDQIPIEYHKFFGEQLCLSEYGSCKLKNLVPKFSDVMALEGEGAKKFVHLTCAA